VFFRCAPAPPLLDEAILAYQRIISGLLQCFRWNLFHCGPFDSMRLPMRACMSCGIMHPLRDTVARTLCARRELRQRAPLHGLVPRSPAHGMQQTSALLERAARRVLRRYGVGKWRLIQMNEAHGPVLAARSNVDLKVGAAGHARARTVVAHALAGTRESQLS